MFRKILVANRGEIAAVIMEAARSFVPAPGFLEEVKKLAYAHGAVLIFDEVLTGFRMPGGSAQAHYRVTPDLATFAKCISATAGSARR